MGIVEQATIKAHENMCRAGITADVIKQVRQQQAAQRQVSLLQPLAAAGMMNVIQRYKDIIDRHIIPPHVGVSGSRAKAPVVLDASGGSANGEGANAGGGDGGDDDGDGEGDSDSDGPRRHSSAISAIRSAASSRSSSRAVRRKLKSTHPPVVIMHTRALVTLVLISLLCLFGALGFVALGYEELALACLGLAALDGWALASKLVKPK